MLIGDGVTGARQADAGAWASWLSHPAMAEAVGRIDSLWIGERQGRCAALIDREDQGGYGGLYIGPVSLVTDMLEEWQTSARQSVAPQRGTGLHETLDWLDAHYIP